MDDQLQRDDAHFHPRPDHKTAKKVEQGINVQALLDTHTAALYLHSRGIDFAVALRVLTRPAHRRHSN